MASISEFCESLGEYVYGYIDNENGGKTYRYVGKGKGERCLAHIKDKGYNIEQCYIFARNLEKFKDKDDAVSYLLESYLIKHHSPIDNSVSGHYEECFVSELSFSKMFDDYKTSQYDNFAKLPDWFIDNYSIFRDKMREVKINASNILFYSNSNNSVNMYWYWANEQKEFKVTFEIFRKDAAEIKALSNKMSLFLELYLRSKNKKISDELVKQLIVVEGNDNQKVSIVVGSMDDVMTLFKGFFN